MSAAEVARVKQQYTAQDAYKRDGTAAVASELSEWIGAGDWRLLFLQRDRITKVTAKEVNEVAVKYLKQSNRTVGIFRRSSPIGLNLHDGHSERAGEQHQPESRRCEHGRPVPLHELSQLIRG